MRTILILLLLSSVLFSLTVFVSPNGDDANPGTEQRPLRSFSVAFQKLKPGDTLVLLPGRYLLVNEEDVLKPPSGSQDGFINVVGRDGAVLEMGNNLMAAIDLSGTTYVRLENIEITHKQGENARDGIIILGQPSKEIHMKNLYVHHLDEFCLDIQDVDGLYIEDSRFTYCGFGGLGGPEGKYGGIRNLVINRSEFSYSGHYYQNTAGPSVYDRPDGIGLEISDGPVTIEQSIFVHNRGDGVDLKTRDATIRRCVVAHNFADGIKLWGEHGVVENTVVFGRGDGSTETTPWSPIVISTERPNAKFVFNSNTIVDTVGNNYVMHVQYDYPEVPVTLDFKNNIVASFGPDAGIFISQKTQPNFDHNLFYMPNTGTIILHDGVDSYTIDSLSRVGENYYADPRLKSTESPYLLSDSPAIDRGGKGYPKYDLLGKERPIGSSNDIGAIEFNLSQSQEDVIEDFRKLVVRSSLQEIRPEKGVEATNESLSGVPGKEVAQTGENVSTSDKAQEKPLCISIIVLLLAIPLLVSEHIT